MCMGVKETEGASVMSATTDLTCCADSRANVSVVTQVIKYQKYVFIFPPVQWKNHSCRVLSPCSITNKHYCKGQNQMCTFLGRWVCLFLGCFRDLNEHRYRLWCCCSWWRGRALPRAVWLTAKVLSLQLCICFKPLQSCRLTPFYCGHKKSAELTTGRKRAWRWWHTVRDLDHDVAGNTGFCWGDKVILAVKDVKKNEIICNVTGKNHGCHRLVMHGTFKSGCKMILTDLLVSINLLLNSLVFRPCWCQVMRKEHWLLQGSFSLLSERLIKSHIISWTV